jgi:phosphate/sulfate permease
VRWEQAARIILVWFTTLPAAIALAAAAGLFMR